MVYTLRHFDRSAIDRLGKQRIVDKASMANEWTRALMANGTDAPVELINPLPFMAQVSRKTLNKP